MKRQLKRCVAGILCFSLFVGMTAMAKEEKSFFEQKANDGTAAQAMYDSKNYILLHMRAKNIRANTEKTELRFENANGTDSNVYVITDDTIYGRIEREIDKSTLNIYDFADGKMEYIAFFIPVGKYYRYSKKENTEIHVSGVWTFAEKAEFIGKAPDVPTIDATDFLRDFGIMEQNKETEKHLTTRAEAVQLMINMLRLKNVAPLYTVDGYFTDVPKSHWGFNAISLAKEARYIAGFDDGTFRPDAPVSRAEAVKLILTALGYAPRAAQLGSYPAGYLAAALETGLLSVPEENPSAPLTRREIADMIYTAVYLPVMEQVVFDAVPEYAVRNGENGSPLIRFYDRFLDRIIETEKPPVPKEKPGFTYDFQINDAPKSDFGISPASHTSTITVSFSANSSSHNVVLSFWDVESGKVTFSDTVTVSAGADGAIFIPYGAYTGGRTYRISLSSPSEQDAAGKMWVSVNE